MAHTYVPLDDFKKFMVDGGTDYGTISDDQLLAILEAASRRVDEYCERSHGWGSGFGPRIGTNYYDPVCGNLLELDDDLLSITSVTTYDTVGGNGTTITDVTDFFKEPYSGPPYRRLRIHEESSKVWGAATRGNVVVLVAGYQDVRTVSTTTVASGLASDAAATTFVTSASPTIQIGQTLYIGTEHLYVTGLSGTTATVERGANGSTAAVHANSSAISVFRYPKGVVNGTRQIAQRTWKTRDAGASGGYGGGGIPNMDPRDTEWSILNATVGRFCYRSAG